MIWRIAVPCIDGFRWTDTGELVTVPPKVAEPRVITVDWRGKRMILTVKHVTNLG